MGNCIYNAILQKPDKLHGPTLAKDNVSCLGQKPWHWAGAAVDRYCVNNCCAHNFLWYDNKHVCFVNYFEHTVSKYKIQFSISIYTIIDTLRFYCNAIILCAIFSILYIQCLNKSPFWLAVTSEFAFSAPYIHTMCEIEEEACHTE